MIKKVEKFIEEKHLLSPGAKIIIGLSGGADSMAMLDILTLLGYQCIAAHCNFHLRVDESDSDAIFVKKWCKSIDIDFVSIDFDTREFAADKKISIEMAARELRYNWFEIIRKQYEAEAIVVAHHKDDLIETVLLNMIRGTGIRGLTGISPCNGYIVRPMLCLSRIEIEEYLTSRGIPNIFDSSNNDDTFTRNSIRLNVIPLLENINPSVKDAIFRTSNNLREVNKIYDAYVSTAIEHVFSDNRINIRLLKETYSPSAILYEILSTFGFNSSVISDVYDGIDSISGKVYFSENYRLVKDRDYFILNLISEKNDLSEYLIDINIKEINIPIRLKMNFIKNDVSIIRNQNYLYADADKLKFPLLLRKWRVGDWFIPFGMKGKKKLSDFFTDRKLNINEKENAWVLVSGEEIVWIVGLRSDERFKITEKTSKVFIIEYSDDI